MTTKRKVSEIQVDKRIRQDMGDIDALAESIRLRGLLQPIAIWPDNKLACGERRFLAVQKLGWTEVSVYLLHDKADLIERLLVERDENTQHKPFTPSEAVAFGKVLEEAEKPKAKERQQEHGGTAPGRAKNTGGKLPRVIPGTGKTRDKVAEAVGMSGRTYEKAKRVVEAADEQPDLFVPIQEEMDRSGKVDSAFKKVQEIKNPPVPKPPPVFPHSDRFLNWLNTVSGQTCIIDIELSGITAMLSEPKKWDWREVREHILPMLDALIRTISIYRKEIQTHANQQK